MKDFCSRGAIFSFTAHNRARTINPVHLEHTLRNIETNCDNLAHGRLPSTWFALAQPPYGTSMPQSGRRPQHQSRHIQRALKSTFVHYAFNSDRSGHESELTRRARSGHRRGDLPVVGTSILNQKLIVGEKNHGTTPLPPPAL